MVKRLVLSIWLITIVFFESCGVKNTNPLEGTWSGDSYGQQGSVKFEASSVTASIDGTSVHGTYSVDDTVSPMHVDFNWEKGIRFETIAKFTGKDELKIILEHSGTNRPTNFSTGAVILKRM